MLGDDIKASSPDDISWINWFLDTGMKIFAPKRAENIKTFNTKDGVYTGEIVNDQMNGFGLLIYDSGDVYFGEFENNQKHGEGILIFCVGTVLRSMFDYGYCTGYSLLRCPGQYSYMMSFVDGFLQGPCTIINEPEKAVKALSFENGEYVGTIKSFKSGTDNFVQKLLYKIFPIDDDEAKLMNDISRSINNKFVNLDDEIYIGTFYLNNYGAYFGVIKNGQPFNYGILITEDFKIKIGCFKEGCLNGRARIIEKTGLILEGNYRNDLAYGEAYLYHSRQNVWKHIQIKEKGGSDLLDSGKGYPREKIVEVVEKLKSTNNLPLMTGFEEDRQVIFDLSLIKEKMFFYLYGTNKENIESYEDNLGLSEILNSKVDEKFEKIGSSRQKNSTDLTNMAKVQKSPPRKDVVQKDYSIKDDILNTESEKFIIGTDCVKVDKKTTKKISNFADNNDTGGKKTSVSSASKKDTIQTEKSPKSSNKKLNLNGDTYNETQLKTTKGKESRRIDNKNNENMDLERDKSTSRRASQSRVSRNVKDSMDEGFNNSGVLRPKSFDRKSGSKSISKKKVKVESQKGDGMQELAQTKGKKDFIKKNMNVQKRKSNVNSMPLNEKLNFNDTNRTKQYEASKSRSKSAGKKLKPKNVEKKGYFNQNDGVLKNSKADQENIQGNINNEQSINSRKNKEQDIRVKLFTEQSPNKKEEGNITSDSKRTEGSSRNYTSEKKQKLRSSFDRNYEQIKKINKNRQKTPGSKRYLIDDNKIKTQTYVQKMLNMEIDQVFDQVEKKTNKILYGKNSSNTNYDHLLLDDNIIMNYYTYKKSNSGVTNRPVADLTDLIDYPGKTTIAMKEFNETQQHLKHIKASPKAWKDTRFQRNKTIDLGRSPYKLDKYRNIDGHYKDNIQAKIYDEVLSPYLDYDAQKQVCTNNKGLAKIIKNRYKN